ncbi:transmembrane protein, putative [Medicago truncatula]|uniref:Transmembrane protein, putative n=1 Tax=Medicago truncatula TaxID=3880 RepID=G7JA30_MEDTR|nr:transmembrane protein, putative [Medicago truncatula]
MVLSLIMKMFTQKCFIFFVCLLIISPKLTLIPNSVEGRKVFTINRKENDFKGYSKREAYSTLGLVCKCCDGEGGDCISTWDASCSNLMCKPWKY